MEESRKRKSNTRVKSVDSKDLSLERNEQEKSDILDKDETKKGTPTKSSKPIPVENPKRILVQESSEKKTPTTQETRSPNTRNVKYIPGSNLPFSLFVS